ncbi:MAG: helix-turn-helix transcriptional regulator, partial [Gemmatimonadales bacterium]
TSAVRLTGSTFEPRADFREVIEPADLFRASPDQLETVVVRFAPGITRWVRTRYPDHRVLDDGRVEVDLSVASEAWLVRRVLDHGPDAEVVSPARYRTAVRRALA